MQLSTIFRCLFASFAACVYLCCCTKKTNTAPIIAQPAPAVSSYKGVVCGHIAPYDTYGFRFNPKNLDVQVTLSGIGSVYADSMGYFQFDSVPTGSYTLSAKGLGMGATEVRNVQMFKDTCYQPISMSEIPTFNVVFAMVHPDSTNGSESIEITLHGNEYETNFLVFVSTTDDAQVAAGNYALAKLLVIRRRTGNSWLYIDGSEFREAGIAAGVPIYYTVCSYAAKDGSKYINQTTGKWVYTAIGTPIHLASIAP